MFRVGQVGFNIHSHEKCQRVDEVLYDEGISLTTQDVEKKG